MTATKKTVVEEWRREVLTMRSVSFEREALPKIARSRAMGISNAAEESHSLTCGMVFKDMSPASDCPSCAKSP